MLAVRELASRIVAEGGVIPILEPVKTTATSLEILAETGLHFLFITNPLVGEIAENPALFPALWNVIEESDSTVPSLIVRENTSVQTIQDFAERFSGYQLGFVYLGNPSSQAAAAARMTPAIYHVLHEQATSVASRREFVPEQVVLLSDPFNRQVRNADYPSDEFFSDKHLTSADLAGFADYSVAGSDWTESGGPALAVALHHLVFNDSAAGPLHIRHFVSSSTETPSDTPGKFLEALEQLVTFLPHSHALCRRNVTDTCDEYASLFVRQHYPGLGAAKKLAIKHHIELFLGT